MGPRTCVATIVPRQANRNLWTRSPVVVAVLGNKVILCSRSILNICPYFFSILALSSTDTLPAHDAPDVFISPVKFDNLLLKKMHQRFSYGPPVPTFFVYPPLSNTRQCIQTHRQPALQRATFTGYSDVNMPRQKLWSYPPWIPQDYYILFPVEGQRRRWSETAATEVRTGEEEVRRWSMHPPLTRTDYSNLKYPYLWEDRVWDPEWQTATVGTMHTTVGDGLADALQLLSLRPLSKVIHNPTPTNTTSSHSIQHESWPLDTNSKSHYPGVEAGVEKASTVSATIDIPATVAQILNFLWTDEEPIYVGCVKRSSDLASLQEED